MTTTCPGCDGRLPLLASGLCLPCTELRDRFAIAALAAINDLATPQIVSHDADDVVVRDSGTMRVRYLATAAYAVADAMLEARKRKV